LDRSCREGLATPGLRLRGSGNGKEAVVTAKR
jgi:hypothetical protein